MISQESSLQQEILGVGRIRLFSPKPCDEIVKSLSVLEFNIQQSTVRLSAKGYLYDKDGKCFVGIESIPDKFNHIRLGRVFLRNFYTVLDFENNYIMLGINLSGDHNYKASINGPLKESIEKAFNGGTLTAFLILLLIAGLVGGFFYWRKRKEQ